MGGRIIIMKHKHEKTKKAIYNRVITKQNTNNYWSEAGYSNAHIHYMYTANALLLTINDVSVLVHAVEGQCEGVSLLYY